MPRFVILEHDHPALHWDLMLERAGALATWRLERPFLGAADDIPALKLDDHRLTYLDYEGPVSGGRGTVVRWDVGTYEEVAHEGYALTGRKVRGTIHLVPRASAVWLCHWQAS